MGEPQQTIAVAGRTPFAFVLAGLLAADHGCRVHIIAPAPSPHTVPPPPSLSIAPVTRLDTLSLVAAHAPDMMRRLARIAPTAIDRSDLVIRATTPFHATALSHFRHLATGFGYMVERQADDAGSGATLRVRDIERFSPAPFLTAVKDWAAGIGLEWVDDPSLLAVRRNGTAQLSDTPVDRLVLADDEAILAHLSPGQLSQIGKSVTHMAYIAEAGHGVDDPELVLPTGTLLNRQRDGTLAIHADNTHGLADARAATVLPAGTRRAAARPYTRLITHDGAPVVGSPKGSRAYVVAGLGPLDIALAPVIARHICGKAHGFEAEWCGMRGPNRDMGSSIVADIAQGSAA